MAGYIIIKHQVFGEITDDEVLKYLDVNGSTPKYRIFDVKRQIIGMEQIHDFDSQAYRIYQQEILEKEIKPYIDSNPDHKVLYFGTASIPLALHFGYCFGSWKPVEVYLLHRENMTWGWSNDSKEKLPATSKFVGEHFSGSIDVVYAVEATYTVNEDELKEVVPTPCKTIRLSLNSIGKDVFRSQEQLQAFAYQFSLGLDTVASNLPGADKIHLFATVPVGLAFLMGTKINPLVTKPIVAYQFNRSRIPPHEPVLILQEVIGKEVNITEEDAQFIQSVRAELKQILGNQVAGYATSKREEAEKHGRPASWIEDALPEGAYPDMEAGYWKHIPSMSETILHNATLSDDIDKAEEGFYITELDQWQISDRFIFNIMNRLTRDKKKIMRALRMFIFHEALHVQQGLTNYTASGIGRFPRVLEEADYIADVWAMVYEYAFSKVNYRMETADTKGFFMEMIDIASKTMLAFDDLDPNINEMQVRRVNRYLIWYWNMLQIEDRLCKSLQDIIEILAVKPLIEIKGLDIRAEAQRTLYRLTGFKQDQLELGYLDKTARIERNANAGGLQISEIVKGFRERNGEQILHQLKSFHHQIRKV
jgi:hypothetical protein